MGNIWDYRVLRGQILGLRVLRCTGLGIWGWVYGVTNKWHSRRLEYASDGRFHNEGDPNRGPKWYNLDFGTFKKWPPEFWQALNPM